MKRVLTTLAAMLLVGQAMAGNYIGEYAPGDTIDCKFTTYRPSTGATFTLGGTPAVSAYKDNSTTQSTSGVTLSADFDTVTGLNNVRVTTASDGTFYSAGSFFSLIITTGTVDSVSVTGSEVCSFSLNKEAGLRPTTAARTLDVTTTGEAGIDWANIGGPTTTVNLSGTTISTSQAVASVSGAVGSVTGAVGSVTGNVGGNVTGSVGSVATGGITEASFATTAGSMKPLGIVDQGTAQSATGTTLVLRSALAMADDTAIGMTLVACGSTQGYCQARAVTDYVSSTDTATVDTWTVTPSGTVTYYLIGTAPNSGSGGGLDAAGVRAAVGLASANLDTQLAAIDDYVDTEVAAIKTKTDFLPSATAGSSGGVFIAGTNAATTVTTAFTSTFTGNLTGNVGGTVNGLTATAQGNVRTAVGLASANLDTQLTAIDDYVDTEVAAILDDTGTSGVVVASGSKTGYALSAAGVDAIWDEAQSGHATAGTFGLYLDAAISGVSTGGVSAATIADAVWDEDMTAHQTQGTAGQVMGDSVADTDSIWSLANTNLDTTVSSRSSQTSVDTVDDFVDTEVSTLLTRLGTPADLGGGASVAQNLADIEAQTDDIGAAGAGLTAADDAVMTRLGTPAGASVSADIATRSSQTSVDDLPTNSELATALGTADDATLAAVAALPTDIRDLVIEDQGSGITLGCALAIAAAYAAGDLSTTAGTSTYEDPSGTETRITGTVASAGNRSATITCPSY